MKRKLYNYIPQQYRELLSLNFLLAEKQIVEWSSIDIKDIEEKENSQQYDNSKYFCMIFYKHISRYLNEVQNIKIEKI